MSCSNATAPINLGSDQQGSCTLKCDYTFSYNNSDSTATNHGNYISMTYDTATNAQVTYNTQKYNVQEIRLYQPSLHTFNGWRADAEMIIYHTSTTGSLIVCVPISGSPAQTASSAMLDLVVPRLVKYAGATGDSAQLRLDQFNLNDIVPIKPFYSYIGTLPYSPCNGSHSYVVFDAADGGSAQISSDNLESLRRLISASSKRIATDVPYFYNQKGPSKTLGAADDIYIDCQPTGEDGETLVPIDLPSGPSMPFTKEKLLTTLKNPWVIALLVGIGMFMILKLIQHMFEKLGDMSAAKKMSSARPAAILKRAKEMASKVRGKQ